MALEKFCFCCKLHNGAFIWGVLSIIFCSIALITTVSSDLFVEKNFGQSYINEFSGEKIIYSYHKTSLYWLFVIGSTMDLIASILLVVGVVKKNHYMMLPWIILHGIALIPLALAGFVVLIATLPIYGPIYIWWCICSAYQKIQEVPAVPFNNFFSASVSDSYPYPKPDEDA